VTGIACLMGARDAVSLSELIRNRWPIMRANNDPGSVYVCGDWKSEREETLF